MRGHHRAAKSGSEEVPSNLFGRWPRAAWPLLLVVITLAGCGSASTSSDATVDAAVDAPADSSLDGGLDADAGDAAFDAGPPPCEDQALEAWDLGAGVWSPDLGPRGLSFDGPGPAQAWDLAVHEHALFVAGQFSHAGPIATSNVVAWTADAGWRALGAGVPVAVRRIAVAPDGTAYVAGRTTGIDPAAIYRYAGGVWASIGSANGEVEDLAIDVDGSLLAGGFFRAIDAVSTPNSFARWDGSSWTSLDKPVGFDVAAILVDDAGLCIGGRQVGSGGYVACHAPGSSSWDVMPTPRRLTPPGPNPVNAIVHDVSGRVVIGGGVYLGSGAQLGGVLRWTAGAWENLGPGLGDFNSPMEVFSIARANDGGIYAVGTFTTIGSHVAPTAYVQHVARWFGERWQSIGGVQGGYPPAFTVATDGPNSYFGGRMTETFSAAVGGPWHEVAGVVRYEGSSWHPLDHPGSVAHGPRNVEALAVRAGCRPYVAGDFQVIEDRLVSHVGEMAVDGAIDGVASRSGFQSFGPAALAVGADGTLYAGGSFDLAIAGGLGVRTPLARRSGGEWEDLGTFAPGASVSALAVAEDGSLYVGGTFTDATNAEGSHLLRWDGSVWSAVGARVAPEPVSALSVDGSALYIAEQLTTGGSRVSRYQAGTWTVLGDPLDGYVEALAVHRGVLVAGGRGLVAGSPVATFDGATWTSAGRLGSDSPWIRALAVLGDELVAGGVDGYSLDSPGILVRRTASGWEDVGGGVDGAVDALAFTADGLLVGGRFDVAGGVPSWGLALLRAP